MKIRIWSDLHSDGSAFPYNIPHLDETLIVAGDTANSWERGCEQIAKFAPLFAHVITVPGNHDYYDGITLVDWHETNNADFNDYMRDNGITNAHMLNPGTIKIDDVTFIGATLWTDFNRGDPLVEWASERGINDFRKAMLSTGRITATWMKKQCAFELEFIRESCKKIEGKKVVVTHFPMLRVFQHPRWGTMSENPLNGYFMSDFDHQIADLEFDVAICGHTHDGMQFEAYDKKFICNPRGYAYRGVNENEEFDADLVITL